MDWRKDIDGKSLPTLKNWRWPIIIQGTCMGWKSFGPISITARIRRNGMSNPAMLWPNCWRLLRLPRTSKMQRPRLRRRLLASRSLTTLEIMADRLLLTPPPPLSILHLSYTCSYFSFLCLSCHHPTCSLFPSAFSLSPSYSFVKYIYNKHLKIIDFSERVGFGLLGGDPWIIRGGALLRIKGPNGVKGLQTPHMSFVFLLCTVIQRDHGFFPSFSCPAPW